MTAQNVNDNTKYWLEFWPKLAEALAWPIIIFIIFIFAFLNRKNIFENLPNFSKSLSYVKSLRVGNAEISFSDELSVLNQKHFDENSDKIPDSKTDNYSMEAESSILEMFSTDKEFEEIAAVKPDLTIIDSWRIVERNIIETYEYLNLESEITRWSDTQMLSTLNKYNKISKSHENFITRLKELRNQVVHNPSILISYSDAKTYRLNCFEAIQILQNAKQS